MKCPYCRSESDRVVDSRSSNEGLVIRRRRECEKCRRRYTTYERIEEVPLFVIKKDQRREMYDRNKVLAGVHRACEKRPVAAETCEAIVTDLEKMFEEKYEKEVPSAVIGEFVMDRLSQIDQVAYVRFASVYRQFKDLSHFMKELKVLLAKK
ncbi:MAG: transcriptional regulator NrdR [Omnitrophica bacterium RIFCSPLOWO2_12_FULL_44_17]|uniref:Transcriptional repressor NrdR n=1 Tax=Candidatus Danuiimicrobium aquiferis TaxID=1801832 RepID=A0A1G1KXA8_9BACT|nr:MAG: transcriptional regulator NrdR [Omnitrophica bacterium RIFCSPHIGHO2_02_FULL_45_28]OGW90272.1 MAG: transcriptional regulator NrdR [Omnitrophica bacterium RIFCSPHIGHO2_12_FULL_44_12]OGW97239.1 MAG: transcriptional regulator NrdR [Omnitrophica bacterium RIFCSPLOWO2_12_FULL_44_17]OGX02294.1 MAG: transcriptional regulator NrdR [Omnitrophica bacterium RIFCSPLOWO2_02_FULL_44_11]